MVFVGFYVGRWGNTCVLGLEEFLIGHL